MGQSCALGDSFQHQDSRHWFELTSNILAVLPVKVTSIFTKKCQRKFVLISH